MRRQPWIDATPAMADRSAVAVPPKACTGKACLLTAFGADGSGIGQGPHLRLWRTASQVACGCCAIFLRRPCLKKTTWEGSTLTRPAGLFRKAANARPALPPRPKPCSCVVLGLLVPRRVFRCAVRGRGRSAPDSQRTRVFPNQVSPPRRY